MQKFQDVLDGKLKVTDLTAEEMPDFVKYGQTKTAEILTEVGGVRDARQAEQKKLDDIAPKLTEAQGIIERAEALKRPELSPEMKQMRTEQVDKAKDRLWKDLPGLTDEQKTTILDKFKTLDSGKMDAEFIYKDFASAAAAAFPETFIQLKKDHDTRTQAAEDEIRRQAEANGGKPPEDPKKKFTKEVLDLAEASGVSPEAAQRQLTQGNRRTLDVL